MRNKGHLLGYAVIVLTAGLMIYLQQHKIAQLQQDLAAANEKLKQGQDLGGENERMTAQIKTLEDRSQAERNELMKLRAQTGVARQTQQELDRLKINQARLAEQLASSRAAAPRKTDDDDDQPVSAEAKAIRQRLNTSRSFAIAALEFANAHNGQLPSDFTSLQPYLNTSDSNASPASASEQLELVYTNALTRVTNTSHLILYREKEATPMADGRLGKVYTFVDGHSELLIVPPGGDFAQREAELNFVSSLGGDGKQ